MVSAELCVGDRVSVREWGYDFVFSGFSPFGEYFLFEGEDESGAFIRVIDPSSVSLVKDGSVVDLPDPIVVHKSRSIDFDSIEPGHIVDVRDRLWRVDGVDHEKRLIRVSSISGVEAKHEYFAPVERIRPALHPPPDVRVVGNPGFQRLLLQALKLDLMHGTAELMGLQRSRVIPMSYQLVPVLMALELPEARLLLADDVGLGKTIEAGLIVSELLGRRLAERVLFVTPANLREQWQDILRRFFHIDARIISKRHLRQLERELLVGGDPWGHFPFLITSIDYAKQGHILQRIQSYHWDVVVIDEAHNAAKPHEGVPSPGLVMQRWTFAKTIAQHCRNLLLLTATPHNGYRDSFASLLEMLNPDIVSGQVPDVAIDKGLARRHVCQRRREDVKEWLRAQNLGDDPFPERDHREEFVSLSSELREVIDSVNAFSDHILRTVVDESVVAKRVARWTILHFHKRALSSPYAVKCSLRNRIQRIDEQLDLEASKPDLGMKEDDARRNVFDFEISEDLPEEEVDLRTDRVIFGSREALLAERALLEVALVKCDRVTSSRDAKLHHLLRNSIPWAVDRARDRKPKVIVFTRYKDTLDYLVDHIEREVGHSFKLEGMRVFGIHGGMNHPRRKEEYEAFRAAEKGVLVTTDCMAEGIDLQYSANQVIHYELPWNPNRLEQRNGRVDRFGQPKEMVYVRTLIMQDTLEAAILENLITKANQIRADYGFAPPFFGDDLAVLDAIVDYRLEAKYGPQRTLYEFFETRMDRERERALQLVDGLLDADVVRRMQEDSFYGQSGVDLNEVTRRMAETEAALGGKDALYRFVRSAVVNVGGSLQKTGEDDVFKLVLPEEQAERFGVSVETRVTFNQRRGVADPSLYVLDLGSSVVSGLLDHVLTLSYLPEAESYGRTAAVGSDLVERVTAVFHVRMRYLVNTEPKSVIEEIVPIGLEPYGERVLDRDEVEALVDSDFMAHGQSREDIVEALGEALMHPRLMSSIREAAEFNCGRLVDERREIREGLERDGLTKGLGGFDEVSCASQDILTITLYYPRVWGGV